MRYEVVERLRGDHAVVRSCQALELSTSGYYSWRSSGSNKRVREDRILKRQIVEVHAVTKGRYGTPRVEKALREKGFRTSRKRVGRLRQELGLRAKAAKKFRTTTDSRHSQPIAPNRLDRKFEAPSANRKWVTDITYLWTLQGWLYLAIVLDTYSRKIVGWSLSSSLDREVAIDALKQALEVRRPKPGLLHHSDRGTQYCSDDYQALLAEFGLVPSMSRKGDCWDNAMAESFFKTLKTELGARFDSFEHARSEIFEYIEGFYNSWRLHSALDYQSPANFEREALRRTLAA